MEQKEKQQTHPEGAEVVDPLELKRVPMHVLNKRKRIFREKKEDARSKLRAKKTSITKSSRRLENIC